jgi:hypothetical protein
MLLILLLISSFFTLSFHSIFQKMSIRFKYHLSRRILCSSLFQACKIRKSAWKTVFGDYENKIYCKGQGRQLRFVLFLYNCKKYVMFCFVFIFYIFTEKLRYQKVYQLLQKCILLLLWFGLYLEI